MYKAVAIYAAEGCLPGFSILGLKVNGIRLTWMSLLCNYFLCSTQQPGLCVHTLKASGCQCLELRGAYLPYFAVHKSIKGVHIISIYTAAE